jgi:ABC-type antimicrobial peptide transport system permease subunit
VIVNAALASRYFPGEDPVGHTIVLPDLGTFAAVRTIVGVAADVREKSLDLPGEPAFYSSMTQFPLPRATAVVSLSGADAGAVEGAIRTEIHKLDPRMAVDFELASDVVGSTIRRQELGMTLMLVFGCIAIVLAAVGIYGVVSYAGSLRREEMATRLALGASPRDVFVLVMRQGAMLGLIGAVIGIGLAYVSGRIVSNQVYAIRASDPITLAVATVLIITITVLATTIPATRASRLNPASALQSE